MAYLDLLHQADGDDFPEPHMEACNCRDFEAVAPEQPPFTAPEVPPLVIHTHDIDSEPWDIRYVSVEDAERMQRTIAQLRLDNAEKDARIAEVIEERRLALNKVSGLECQVDFAAGKQ